MNACDSLTVLPSVANWASRLVLEGRRVRQIDDDLRSFERFSKAFASDCVDAGIGRRCKSLMPALRQLAHDLRTDESGSSDHYDLHDFAFHWTFSQRDCGSSV